MYRVCPLESVTSNPINFDSFLVESSIQRFGAISFPTKMQPVDHESALPFIPTFSLRSSFKNRFAAIPHMQNL